jgi:hypothetical protein
MKTLAGWDVKLRVGRQDVVEVLEVVLECDEVVVVELVLLVVETVELVVVLLVVVLLVVVVLVVEPAVVEALEVIDVELDVVEAGVLVLEGIELVLVVSAEPETTADVDVMAELLVVVVDGVVLAVERDVGLAVVDEKFGEVEEDEPDPESARYAPAAITAMIMMTITAIAVGARALLACIARAHSDWSI